LKAAVAGWAKLLVLGWTLVPARASAEPPSIAAPAVQPAVVPAAEGPVAVSTRLTPDPSHVGDLLTLEIIAAYPRGYSVNLPIGVKLAPLHVVAVEEDEPEATGEGLRKRFTVQLQHFAPGPATVPGLTLTYVDEAGAIQTVAVPPVAFTVDALLANEAEPQRKPEDPPISIEYPNELAETVAYSVLATLAAALVAWLALRRLLRRRKPVATMPAIPPHRLALDALDELERSSLLGDGRVQDYYVQLTEIGKGYLERRFGVDALDRTTDEIRRALLRDRARIAPLSASDVVEFLQRCDLVKFARMLPHEESAREELAFVRDTVERTAPEAQSAPAVEPAPVEGRSDHPPDASEPDAKDGDAR
jgi:hypothetical protein